jgi:hypothetical protein
MALPVPPMPRRPSSARDDRFGALPGQSRRYRVDTRRQVTLPPAGWSILRQPYRGGLLNPPITLPFPFGAPVPIPVGKPRWRQRDRFSQGIA